jgi:hypothetical protein
LLQEIYELLSGPPKILNSNLSSFLDKSPTLNLFFDYKDKPIWRWLLPALLETRTQFGVSFNPRVNVFQDIDSEQLLKLFKLFLANGLPVEIFGDNPVYLEKLVTRPDVFLLVGAVGGFDMFNPLWPLVDTCTIEAALALDLSLSHGLDLPLQGVRNPSSKFAIHSVLARDDFKVYRSAVAEFIDVFCGWSASAVVMEYIFTPKQLSYW